jgi:hypothetical protein
MKIKKEGNIRFKKKTVFKKLNYLEKYMLFTFGLFDVLVPPNIYFLPIARLPALSQKYSHHKDDFPQIMV